jgi:very-long-chain (3R)-3-hydroxyacyl-CoA dehydratase
MNVAPTAQTNVFTALACTSWSLVEVPRYLFYATKELSMTPDLLLWLRYSLFAILYPTGISGELGCMYYAYLELMVSKDTSLVFLSHAIMAVALTYIPGSPTMFMHMVNERKKNIGVAKKNDEKKK